MKKLYSIPPKSRGFALVVTLSLMILLTVIAVGLLSLSAVSMRTSSQALAQAEAQANARMALMMAIGELQKNTGADTRITAPSDIVQKDSPPILGVWKSWEGTDHDATGRPIKPDYTSKSSPNGRFLTWLVSGATLGGSPTKPGSLASGTADAQTVRMIASGSLGAGSNKEVHLIPIPVKGDDGRIDSSYAWWISGENQKARLMQPYKPRTNDEVGWADQAKSYTIPDVAGLGLDSLLDDPESFVPDSSNAKALSKVLSRNTIGLLGSTNPQDSKHLFHDYSSSAVGLLTNVATGGWRKDMSILTEKWDAIYTNYPGAKLPLFRYSPTAGNTSAVPKPTANTYDIDQSGLYPWSGYSQYIGSSRKSPMTYSAASSSWQSLVNFATSYKSITFDESSKTAKIPLGWTNVISGKRNGTVPPNSSFYNYYHKNEYNPIVARIQLIVQINAVPESVYNAPTQTTKLLHRLNMRVVPVFTLWNPYNVEITKTISNPYKPGVDLDVGIGSERSLPGAISFVNATFPHPTTTFANSFRIINRGNSWSLDGVVTNQDTQLPANIAKGYGNGGTHYGDRRGFTGWLPLTFTLKPGEAKVFAPSHNTMTWIHLGTRLKEGYLAGDDFGMAKATPAEMVGNWGGKLLVIPSGRPSGQVLASDMIRFGVKADRHTGIFSNTTKTGPGSHWTVGTTQPGWALSLAQINLGETDKGVDPELIRASMGTVVDEQWASKYWPSNELDEVQYRVSEIVPGGGNPPWTNLYSISFGPRFSFGAGSSANQKRPLKGILQGSPFVSNTYSIPDQTSIYHPANNAFDFSYHSMAINSNLSPEVGNSGYIVSGFQSGDGLSRLIMAEIPLRPMASLVELQSWNLRGNNPLPPYQCNLIGNSDATPLIQQGSILPPVLSLPTDTALTNLQHDDSYCANHLLFDDWFLSTIATQPKSFGSTIAKSIDKVYQDYLEGNAPLTNRAYRPIYEDRTISSSAASTRVTDIVNSPKGDGWLKVASRFEVDGMFNVNSTSVKAWRSLLGHARKQQLALYGANGINVDSSKYEYSVSRHTVTADVEASTAKGLGAAFPSGSEYSGFRTLSEQQLDELAEKIVQQIQKRGPFLSLSEFVNRQLNGSDEELALAGALQTALNLLTTNPNENLKKLSNVTMDANNDKVSDAGYSFKAASKGVDTYGLPGWIRQADILRPIAPVLNARDDTFTIRAYGDARDANGKIIARAWCEAVVKRTRDFVDSADAPDSVDAPTNPANQIFGRKYILSEFRWLNANEI